MQSRFFQDLTSLIVRASQKIAIILSAYREGRKTGSSRRVRSCGKSFYFLAGVSPTYARRLLQSIEEACLNAFP